MLSLTMRTALIAALQTPLAFAHPPATPGFSAERTCIVQRSPNGTDSAPAIIQAFSDCGHNEAANRGKVVFLNETYTVKSVMNTTGLSNVDVELHGTLLWDTNIQYWLNHSLPVGYQNQTSAWLFGGENVTWDGFGYGTLDGNGQVWVSTYISDVCRRFQRIWHLVQLGLRKGDNFKWVYTIRRLFISLPRQYLVRLHQWHEQLSRPAAPDHIHRFEGCCHSSFQICPESDVVSNLERRMKEMKTRKKTNKGRQPEPRC